MEQLLGEFGPGNIEPSVWETGRQVAIEPSVGHNHDGNVLSGVTDAQLQERR